MLQHRKYVNQNTAATSRLFSFKLPQLAATMFERSKLITREGGYQLHVRIERSLSCFVVPYIISYQGINNIVQCLSTSIPRFSILPCIIIIVSPPSAPEAVEQR